MPLGVDQHEHPLVIGDADLAKRRERRIAELYDTDAQFRAARPDPAVLTAATKPGLRLAEVLQTFFEGYSERPALGQREIELITDPETGRTSASLLPVFETITYRRVWQRVRALAAAWTHDAHAPLTAGDFVATIGFSSADYFVVDLACAYLGLVAVPLQHNATLGRLQPMISETAPKVIAVSATYLELAVAAAAHHNDALRHLVVLDYRPGIDAQREALQNAREQLAQTNPQIVVEVIDDVVAHAAGLPSVQPYTGGSPDRLAMILYTSGSTGTPKGGASTEAAVARLWTSSFLTDNDAPAINVNFMPLNHVVGRLSLISSVQAGGTNYFVAQPDLSTLFDDWALVRPTALGLVPRVVEMLYQRHRNGVERLISQGADPAAARRQADTELREKVLGGRVVSGFVSTAPLSAEMRTFLDTTFATHFIDGYGSTEAGAVARDGVIVRPPVTDYKLVDVPELGYFTTDRPHPRGELRVKSAAMFPGYFKRPETTAEVFDDEGYYKTGDVMAEIAPDHLVYLDRRNNVLKLAHGEFVAIANLEAIYTGAALVNQVFVYGNSERSGLLAVVVPTQHTSEQHTDPDALKAALTASLHRTATAAELQPYEFLLDILVETEPFTVDNGLLSGVGKLLRPNLTARYRDKLEQMYSDIDSARDDELRQLRDLAASRPAIETVVNAAAIILGSRDIDHGTHFLDLGGDSLSALTFANLLDDVFGIEVPVARIINPAGDLADLANFIVKHRSAVTTRPSSSSVHGGDHEARAADLTLDKFIDAATLSTAPELPRATGEPGTVLLTGATGWLGRFLVLQWLAQKSRTGGTLIALVRGRNNAEARQRLDAVYAGDAELAERYHALAADHLTVLAGDVAEPDLGVDVDTWHTLAGEVDLIVHPAALVNHVLPYRQLFGPNVVGTAEVIRLALTNRIKAVNYLSTVAVAMSVDSQEFLEDGDIRSVSSTRPINGDYANGYANSKWAGEVLLREAHDLCALPVAVFRCDMILAHSHYPGQLNVPDMFTRLLLSLLYTGIAPETFYRTTASAHRPRAHYDGLPVDFVAEAITSIGRQTSHADHGFRSYDVMNPHDDGVSLDTVVDWLIHSGHPITRLADYRQWLDRFETRLRSLPEQQRQLSVLPLLHAYRSPEQPLLGAAAPTEVFQQAVKTANLVGYEGIPHIDEALINKYLADLKRLNLL
ncbi:carboxylic acid reductase [Mycobacterium sp. MUNTM1]